MTPLKIIERRVVHYPKIILVLTFFLGIVALPSLFYLENDPSPHLLPPSHPVRHMMKQLREDYTGANPGVFIMLEVKDTIFKVSTLDRIQRLTEAIQNLKLLSREDLEALSKMAVQLPGEAGLHLRKLLPKEVGELDDMFWMEIDEIREKLENDGQWSSEWDAMLRNLEVRASPVLEVMSISNMDNIIGSEEGLTIDLIFEEIPETLVEMNSLRHRVLGNDLFRNYFFS